MELNEMELNGREDQLNPIASTVYGSGVYNTHDKKVVEKGKGNREMA